MKEITIGIDIGGTNSVFGLVDRQGNIIVKGSVPTATHERIEDFIEELSKRIKSVVPNGVEVMGLGIGAPNANYYDSTIENAPNLRWKGTIQLDQLFHRYFELPVAVTNDANAAALGEMIYGNAKGMNDFIIITLGTGVGSGIVVNGEVVYGHDGFAGEMGHAIAIPGGRPCTCGRRGCLETYASARGVIQTVVELLEASDTESILRNIPRESLTPKLIFEAAQEGDEIACQTFNYTGKVLGEKLADAIAYTSPEAIFFFGGVARAGDFLLDPTSHYMEATLLNLYKGKVKILPSGLPESDAAVLGASALSWKEIEASNQYIPQSS